MTSPSCTQPCSIWKPQGRTTAQAAKRLSRSCCGAPVAGGETAVDWAGCAYQPQGGGVGDADLWSPLHRHTCTGPSSPRRTGNRGSRQERGSRSLPPVPMVFPSASLGAALAVARRTPCPAFGLVRAEGVGFEPTRSKLLAVFKTACGGPAPFRSPLTKSLLIPSSQAKGPPPVLADPPSSRQFPRRLFTSCPHRAARGDSPTGPPDPTGGSDGGCWPRQDGDDGLQC